MAVYGSTVLNLTDWAKRLDPTGQVSAIAELLGATNEILDDMQWKEGNLPTGERATIRTGLPTVYWRLLNQGIAPSKSVTAQVDESCGMLEAWSECDKDLCELNGNTSAFRLSEAGAFIESMNQEFASTLFYGNTNTNPEKFNGLHIRYSDLTAENAENIINCTSDADAGITSIWLVVWGPNTCHGIFPKGSQAGLLHEDLGLVTVESTAGIGGNRLRAYQSHWQWKSGLVVKDWRYVVRGANIDVSELATNVTATDLGATMVKMLHRIPTMGAGNAVFYVNRTVAQALDLQGRSSVSGGALLAPPAGGSGGFSTQYGAGSYGNYEGRVVQSFRGVPIRTCDSILTSETLLS